MSYEVQITKRAEREMQRLTPKIRRQVIEKILSLEENPRPQDIAALRSEPGAYRVDSGEYRILFYIDDEAAVVTVFRVRHRREVYRNL